MINRRQFVALAAGGIAAGLLSRIPSTLADEPAFRSKIKAVAFDAFPIFDPRPINALTETLFPSKGAELGNEWHTRQFEYTWLRVSAGRYVDFWQVTKDSLEYAADKLHLDLPDEKRDLLMNAYLTMKAWPDALPALTALKKSGLKLALLSNFTARMLNADIRSAGLPGLFDHVLSTDSVKSYKPDPRAYQLGVDALGLPKEEILFVAFAGWDAAGAKMFGYPTFWANRLQAPLEKLDAPQDASGRSLMELVQLLDR